MTFEMEPPDEPCPDCGSTHHRACTNIKKRNRQSLRRRYITAQRALFIRAGYTPAKALFLAKQEADKICKVTK